MIDIGMFEILESSIKLSKTNVKPPTFRYTSNVNLYFRIDLEGYVERPFTYFIVLGDGDHGAYEWALCDTDGNVGRHSDDAYGGIVPALADGLHKILFPRRWPIRP